MIAAFLLDNSARYCLLFVQVEVLLRWMMHLFCQIAILPVGTIAVNLCMQPLPCSLAMQLAPSLTIQLDLPTNDVDGDSLRGRETADFLFHTRVQCRLRL